MSDSQANLRKAAVLLASLDRAAAEQLLGQMSHEQAQAARDALALLGSVTPEEQAGVIDEFFRIGPLRTELDAGVELDAGLARRLGMSQRDARTDRARPAFRFLYEAPSELLAPALKREHPQTVAVVLSHLPAEQAARVLAALPAAIQTDVVRRLAHLDETDATIVAEIERGLEDWFAQQPGWQRRRTAGTQALEGMLAAADSSTRQLLLSTLAGHDPRWSEPPSPAPGGVASFHDLLALDDESLGVVLRSADAEVVILALAGAETDLVERVLSQLPLEAAKMLRYGLDHLGPTRLADVEEAQRQLAELAEDLLTRRRQERGARRLSLAA